MVPFSNPPTAARASVLLVDDSATVLKVVGRLLESHGFAVAAVESGEEAFERCLRQHFDLVVSDVNMGAVSGFQLCRLLHGVPETADLPVVLLTEAEDPRSRFWGRTAGAAAYVPKSMVEDWLLVEIERVLDSSPRHSSAIANGASGDTKPLERLAGVLDELLFETTVAAEARRLTLTAEDPQRFARQLLALAASVISAEYLVLRLASRHETSTTVLVRGPWPDPPDQLLECLGVGAVEATAPAVIRVPGARQCDETPELVDSLELPITSGDDVLGWLTAASTQTLEASDRSTLELVAREIGVVARIVLLIEETRWLAATDALTLLPNRRSSRERLELEIGRMQRFGGSFAVALLDLDRFKGVNDRHGHNAGDRVLREVACTLGCAVRSVDLVGRWGGEEFLVVLAEVDEARAVRTAERLCRAVAELRAPEQVPEPITCSLGLAVWAGETSPDRLVDRADRALYEAKGGGRNQVRLAAPDAP